MGPASACVLRQAFCLKLALCLVNCTHECLLDVPSVLPHLPCTAAEAALCLPTPAGGGLFTTTNPEIRRVVPDVKGRTKVKLVYVVLEAQYQSALTQAVRNINAGRDNVRAAWPAWQGSRSAGWCPDAA